jgi:hypothetical protein
MASPTTTRNRKDASLKASAALPNAANTVNTNGIDLGAATPYPVTEQLQVKISNTVATGANTKNINIRLMDSADNSSFANVAQLANPILRVTDNSGIPAGEVTIQLPPNTRRYIRATALGEASGGDASDGTFTIELLF